MSAAKTRQVRVRVTKELLATVKHVAKLAGVTPTQVFNVLLALRVAKRGDQ